MIQQVATVAPSTAKDVYTKVEVHFTYDTLEVVLQRPMNNLAQPTSFSEQEAHYRGLMPGFEKLIGPVTREAEFDEMFGQAIDTDIFHEWEEWRRRQSARNKEWKTKGSKGAKGKRPRSKSKTREVRNTGFARGVDTITNDDGQIIIKINTEYIVGQCLRS